MILFLGTKPGKTISKVISNVACPYCDQRNTLTALTATTYFHLFWISLFKIGSLTTISCAHCKRTYFKDEFNDEMIQAIED